MIALSSQRSEIKVLSDPVSRSGLAYLALPLKEPSQVVRGDPELVSDAPCWQLAQSMMAVDGGSRPSQDPRHRSSYQPERVGLRPRRLVREHHGARIAVQFVHVDPAILHLGRRAYS